MPASETTSPPGAPGLRIAELERERELLNAIANAAPSLLCLVDETGCVRPYASNMAFERSLGYKPEETGGVLFWERYVPPEDAERAQTEIVEVIAGAPTREIDGRWRTREGETIEVVWSCTALPPIQAGLLFLISATDVTERRRVEDEVRISRTRIVEAADTERKRLERNLHDGAQQRLIALLLSLRVARGRTEDRAVEAILDAAVDELAAAVRELRELARGIHPAALSERGLAAALRTLAGRSPVPVDLEVVGRRYEERVEAAAYYLVSEGMANIAKHAEATRATVRVQENGDGILVEIEDDGVGGADASGGSGLRGLADRVAALGGSLVVESPSGGGTRIRAEIPLLAGGTTKAPR